ncbi:hypothetical protein NQ318_015289 [Aromia moschata]|uniref:Uncharacterized protein n=1 Tax=Aromia moschata TaxID=1265417 RepID=A0AAV8XDX0_9CUCU|nr:hypothetical protein NQ318_015289 [Aromia moschata]
MVATDFQPLSIVENRGFLEYSKIREHIYAIATTIAIAIKRGYFAQTESNIDNTSDIVELSPELVDEGFEASNIQTETTESSKNISEASTGTTEQERSTIISYNRNSHQKRKAIENPASTNSSNVDKVIHFLDKRHSDVKNNYDSIDLTFQGYASSVKKSNRRQTIIKYKIAKIIMEEELAQEAETQTESRPGFSSFFKQFRCFILHINVE